MSVPSIYCLSWFGLLMIAVINGSVRDGIYGKRISELRAHQVSTASGIVLFGVYIWILTGQVRIQSPSQAILIGLIWLLMTVTFEFGFFHYVVKYPWEKLLADYNLCKGRIWVLVPLWVAVAPYLFYLAHR